MRVEVLKTFTFGKRKMKRFTKCTIWDAEAEKLISEGLVKEYKGQWPPKKTKFDLFKPKVNG